MAPPPSARFRKLATTRWATARRLRGSGQRAAQCLVLGGGAASTATSSGGPLDQLSCRSRCASLRGSWTVAVANTVRQLASDPRSSSSASSRCSARRLSSSQKKASTSSTTRSFTDAHLRAPFSARSSRGPALPMMTCGGSAQAHARWRRSLDPSSADMHCMSPGSAAHSRRATFATCSPNSRVGTTTTACVTPRSASTPSSSGNK
mmetsp:Transcript_2556/g.7484  ORF Transcript_2556/g.7484 Transcript_2556/m.7484 type:complete len:206 (+) Transcript_2556:392-1009(+)